VSEASYAFAVDIGGTFTDVVAMDNETGDVWFGKVPTTPHQPSAGVLAGVAKAPAPLSAARRFLHGTTLGLNALLQRRGARVGLITTRGFRDLLELGRMNWPPYLLHWEKPPRLVPRRFCREVTERVRADGVVVSPLDEDELRREVRSLLAHGVEVIAVSFLHAYAYPEHELRAREVIAEEFGDVAVALSHVTAREFREHERTTTVVADSMIKPIFSQYIGVMGAIEAKERPIRTLLSGPASGVMGAVALSRSLGIRNLIGCDMGGTSFDAFVIADHEPQLRTTATIAGVPLLMPAIDIATIGAGGGSIAWLDEGGALSVGPHSAGASPGPICYGAGGVEPTFTDAAVVSGLLDPESFLGGDVALDVEAARAGVKEAIAEPLGLSVEHAAAGIVALTEARMAATLEELTVHRGLDPREFTLLAFGGGGPLVALALAQRLGISRVLIPQSPGTFSAWGMLMLDLVHDFARTRIMPLAGVRGDAIRDEFGELEHEAAAALEREGVAPEQCVLLRFIDVRYVGQEHVLSIPVDMTADRPALSELLRTRFEESHLREYGYTLTDPAEATAIRVRAVGGLSKPALPRLPARIATQPEPIGSRVVHRPRAGRLDTVAPAEWPVYAREHLQPGSIVRGPAIVQEAAATTLVGWSHLLTVDGVGNLELDLTGGS
jgi:N-methylhydantoinase A